MSMLYKTFFEAALKGEPDCGGLLAYNYFSGEHITGFEEGRLFLPELLKVNSVLTILLGFVYILR